MNINNDIQRHADAFGRKVAARLTEGSAELPYEVSERLRAARMQALARRRIPQVVPVLAAAGGVQLDEGTSLWTRIASALPLIALAAGLVFIHTVQTERRASEIAEVDAALLTDDLPPAAYADPGFLQFIKSGAD